MGAFFNNFCSQWNIRGDHQVICADLLHDEVVCHVKALRHLLHPDQRGLGHRQRMIRHQGEGHLHSQCGFEQDFPNDLGAGVGIHPD